MADKQDDRSEGPAVSDAGPQDAGQDPAGEPAAAVNDASQKTTSTAAVRKPIWLKIFGHDVTAPVMLILMSLVLFVPGQWTVPPLDRDEPRYTQATKQMLQSGDYVDIRFQEQARHKKPVGIYWLQAASVKLLGQGDSAPLWVYRLPSVLGATLSVLAAFWMARAFVGPAAALIAASFVAMAIIVGVEARLAKTDAMLFLSVLVAQGALARIWLKNADKRLWGLSFVFWTALAFSILIKGPIGPMVVGLTIVGLAVATRKLAWFKASAPVVGLIWMVLLVSPWFVAIWLATDGTFFTEAIGRDLLGKVGQGQESHGAPPLTHLGAMFGIFWPLPAFFLLSLPLVWNERKSPLVVFCLCWFLPSWIVFELVATKLPHYTLPLLPALALPVAAAVIEGAGQQSKTWMRWIAAILLAVPAVGVALGAFAGPVFLGVWPSPPGAVMVAIGAILAVSAAARILRGPAINALAPTAMAAGFVAVGVWGFVGPALTPIWVSPRLVEAMDTLPGCADADRRSVVTAGFHEPSFIFLEGTGTRIVSPSAAADFLSASDGATQDTCKIAAIESREEGAFLEAAKDKGLVPVVRKRVDGLNINGGDQVDIALYQKRDAGLDADQTDEEQQ